MSKKIMILGASILQLPAIEKAKEMGLQVIVADKNPKAVGFNVNGIHKEIISTIDVQGLLEAAERYEIDAILTLATDMPMMALATIAEKMNLVGISRDTALMATNKAEMRKALSKSGVPIPRFFVVSNREEYKMAINAIKNAGLKCIVKPVDNSGSRGIVLLKNYEIDTIEDAYTYSKKSSRSGDLMVEEYMDGPEVSVETLSIDGKCAVVQITDKLTTGAPFFVEMGHSQPSTLPENIKRQICKITKAANRAIGITDGPSHTEIKITNEGPKVVELGARLGGDCITTHLVPLSTGIDMVESCLKIALGEKIKIKKSIKKAAAIRYFGQDHGTIQNITGIDNAEKIAGVKHIQVVRGVGDTLTGIKSSVDRAGFVISQADSVKDAISICNDALSIIKIKVLD